MKYSVVLLPSFASALTKTATFPLFQDNVTVDTSIALANKSKVTSTTPYYAYRKGFVAFLPQSLTSKGVVTGNGDKAKNSFWSVAKDNYAYPTGDNLCTLTAGTNPVLGTDSSVTGSTFLAC